MTCSPGQGTDVHGDEGREERRGGGIGGCIRTRGVKEGEE